MAANLTPHGFRATASTILNELGLPFGRIERQLAHDERNSSRASYNQAEYLPERKKMMQQWADIANLERGRIVEAWLNNESERALTFDGF